MSSKAKSISRDSPLKHFVLIQKLFTLSCRVAFQTPVVGSVNSCEPIPASRRLPNLPGLLATGPCGFQMPLAGCSNSEPLKRPGKRGEGSATGVFDTARPVDRAGLFEDNGGSFVSTLAPPQFWKLWVGGGGGGPNCHKKYKNFVPSVIENCKSNDKKKDSLSKANYKPIQKESKMI